MTTPHKNMTVWQATCPNGLAKMLNELHERLRVELACRTLPDPVQMLRQAREDRDVQLFMALGDHALSPLLQSMV